MALLLELFFPDSRPSHYGNCKCQTADHFPYQKVNWVFAWSHGKLRFFNFANMDLKSETQKYDFSKAIEVKYASTVF